MKHILEFDSIQLSFGPRMILSSVFMRIETGRITGLLGRNGQGKSCLLNIVFGTMDQEKSIRFDNQSIPHPYKRPDLLTFLPQFHFIPGFLRLSRIFNDFSLDYKEFESRFPEFRSRHRATFAALSGGQRRLCEIYLILRSASQFSFLDEPFTQLMPLQIEKVLELLEEVKETKGILITDHLYQHIIDISDDLYVLANGKTYFIRYPEQIEELGYARISPT